VSLNVTGYLFIALLSGYAFSVTFPLSRYYTAREMGYRIYFRSAFYALAICAIGYLIYLNFLIWGWVEGELPHKILSALILNSTEQNYRLAGTGYLILITLCSGLFIGHLFRLSGPIKKIFLKITIEDDDFERLILRAIESQSPLAIELENKKVYVGFIRRAIDPASAKRDVRILPLVSGYREEGTHKLIFTDHYGAVYENFLQEVKPSDLGTKLGEYWSIFKAKLTYDIFYSRSEDLSKIDDYDLVISVDRIVSIRIFDFVAYNDHFNKEKDEAENEPEDEVSNELEGEVSNKHEDKLDPNV
jgi:hypothetical protein